jgi:CheY-like chemotaxis protein
VGFSRVFTTPDGKEALDLIENEESIEVITLDYQMPDMNGIEVLEELSKSTPRHLSVTMITGYPSEELEEEFHSFGSARLLTNYFLSKPVEFEKLEPLMLRAHEELESAKSKSEGNDVITVQGEIEPEDYIEAQPRHQSARLDTIEEKVENLRKRWRRDF